MPEWMKFVGLALQVSIALIVVSLGLRATWADATYLFRQPGLLLRSLLARNVAVPAAALLIAMTLPLVPPVRLAILALSVTAIPPFLPPALLRAEGRTPFVMGLLVSQTLLAIVLVPLTIELFDLALGGTVHVRARALLPVLLKTVLLPLIAGMVLRRFLGRRVSSVAKFTQVAGLAIMALAFFPILFLTWRTMMAQLGNFTLLAMVLLVLTGLAAGHWLGGPLEEDRTALALTAASSHPVLAIAVERSTTAQVSVAASATLLYLVVRGLVVLPYTRHRRGIRTPDQWRSGRDRRDVPREDRDRRRAVG
jgi:BASS family bile acid:Na+ symporter